MSYENANRRTRALRKIRASTLPLEIQATLQRILDLLNPNTAYNLAWPSAANLARRTERSRRTIQWHLQVIRRLGIFKCHWLTPEEAKEYSWCKYGFKIKLDRCTVQAPTLFEVDPTHPLWDSSRALPADVDRQWGEIAQRMKGRRNAKTTSRLSSDPARRPESSLDRDLDSRRLSCVETGSEVSNRRFRVATGTENGPLLPRVNGSLRIWR